MKRRFLSLAVCLSLLAGLFALPAHGAGNKRTTTYVQGCESNGVVQHRVFLGEDHVLYSYNNTVLLDQVVDVRGDSYGNLALREDGTLWEWGDDADGDPQIGPVMASLYPFTADRPTLPRQIMEDVISFDRYEYYDVVVKKDHTLWFRGPATGMEWVKKMDDVVQARLGKPGGRFTLGTIVIAWAVLDTDGVLWNVKVDEDLSLEKFRLDSGVAEIKSFVDIRFWRQSGEMACKTYATKTDGSLWGYLYDVNLAADHEKRWGGVPFVYEMGFPITGAGPLYRGRLLDEAEQVLDNNDRAMAVCSDGSLMYWGSYWNCPALQGCTPSKADNPDQTGEFVAEPTKIMDHVKSVFFRSVDEPVLLKDDGTLQWIFTTENKTEHLEDRIVTLSGEDTRYDLGDEGYISVQCEPEQVIFSGLLYDPSIEKLTVSYYGHRKEIPFTPGKPFSEMILKPSIEWACYDFSIDVQYAEEHIIPEKTLCLFKGSLDPDTYEFQISQSPSYQEFMEAGAQRYVAPYEIPDDVLTTLSNEIVGDAVDDYEKYVLIHNWIAKNISYDTDGAIGRAPMLPTDAMSVYQNRCCVCDGFANFEVALLRRQSIPVYKVTSEKLNHAWDMVYVHNNWYISDATWDSGERDFNYSVLHPSNDKVRTLEDRVDAIRQVRVEVPSAWAEEEVTSAIDAGVVPMICQNRYTQPMTREYFCRLVVNMIRRASGESVYDFAASAGAGGLANRFTDSKCTDVLCAYQMGVVTGVTDTTFNPQGNITRQEAATMLQRAADYLEVPAGAAAEAFSDADSIAGWAQAGVEFCAGLTTPEGKKVMGGTGNGAFSPTDTYTTEQAILSVYRLYQIAVEAR